MTVPLLATIVALSLSATWVFAAGRDLIHQGKPIRMDLCMIVPVAIDWDKDGDVDLVVGDEDGHFYYLENPGTSSSPPPVRQQRP